MAAVAETLMERSASPGEHLGSGRSRADSVSGLGLARSTFNFITLIIGGGLLGWPNIFKLCGWAGGTLSLCVVCLFAESTMCLVIHCGAVCQTWSYEETCSAIWGRAGFYIIAATCWLMDFGVLITYWVALGDLLSPIAASAFGVADQAQIKLALAIVLLPPCFTGNLGKLPGWAYISYGLVFASLLCMLWLCLQPAVAEYNRDHIEPIGEVLRPNLDPVKSGLWPSLGTLAFTFCSHDGIFMIYQSLREGTGRRWAIVCRAAMWSTVLLMIASGLPLYYFLGDKTASDMTTNFPDCPLMRAVRAALAMTIAMTSIYTQQVARKYLHSLVMPVVRGRALTRAESYRMSRGELVFFTILQFGATLFLGIRIQDLGLPMALTGVFATSLAAFVIPPLLLFTVAWRGDSIGYSRLAQFYFALVLLFGVASCTLGVLSTVQRYS